MPQDHVDLVRDDVDRDEEVELAFLGSDFGDIDMKEAARIGLEPASLGLVAVDIRQLADPMALQAMMQGRSRQMRNRRLQGVKTIVERQERVLSEGDHEASSSTVSTEKRASFGPMGASAITSRRFPSSD